jgi:hypothetical protein
MRHRNDVNKKIRIQVKEEIREEQKYKIFSGPLDLSSVTQWTKISLI